MNGILFDNKVLVEKFFKFCLVGGSGVFIDFGVTYLMKEKFRLNQYLSNSAGFILAASSNFLLNRIWTFQSADPNITAQYLRFIGISTIGLLMNNLVIYICNERFKLNFYLSKLIAIGIVTLWNFGMNYLFNF